MGVHCEHQWRIQDFPEWGANPRGARTNLLCSIIFAKNCNLQCYSQSQGLSAGIFFRDRSVHWPYSWLNGFSGIVPVKAMEWPGAVTPVAW